MYTTPTTLLAQDSCYVPTSVFSVLMATLSFYFSCYRGCLNNGAHHYTQPLFSTQITKPDFCGRPSGSKTRKESHKWPAITLMQGAGPPLESRQIRWSDPVWLITEPGTMLQWRKKWCRRQITTVSVLVPLYPCLFRSRCNESKLAVWRQFNRIAVVLYCYGLFP